MDNFIRGCIVCMLLLMPSSVWATHPLDVEVTGTQGKGNYLFEITADYVKDNSTQYTKEKAIITAGGGEHVDFSLEVPYFLMNPSPVTGDPASGMGDVRLRFKQQLFENEVKQSMAYLVYASLPTGNEKKGLSTHEVVWGVKLIDTQECHQGCQNNIFHVNLGYEVSGRDLKKVHVDRDYAIIFGFAVEHKISESFRVLGEIKGEIRKEVNAETALDINNEAPPETRSYSRPVTVMTGIVYDVTRWWYVDLGVRAGLNKYAEDYAGLVGTAWRF